MDNGTGWSRRIDSKRTESLKFYFVFYLNSKFLTYRGYGINDSFKALRLRQTVKQDYIEDVAKFNYERFWLDLNHHIENS